MNEAIREEEEGTTNTELNLFLIDSTVIFGYLLCAYLNIKSFFKSYFSVNIDIQYFTFVSGV